MAFYVILGRGRVPVGVIIARNLTDITALRSVTREGPSVRLYIREISHHRALSELVRSCRTLSELPPAKYRYKCYSVTFPHPGRGPLITGDLPRIEPLAHAGRSPAHGDSRGQRHCVDHCPAKRPTSAARSPRGKVRDPRHRRTAPPSRDPGRESAVCRNRAAQTGSLTPEHGRKPAALQLTYMRIRAAGHPSFWI